MNAFEIRSGSSLRAISPGKLAGHAALFNSPSQDMGGFVEIIRSGAFTRSLRKPDHIRALLEHDTKQVLARCSSGTLALFEDGKGLAFELSLPDTSYAHDLAALVARGDISGCSFGFRVPEGGDRWEMRGGQLVRDLTDIDLHEISIVGDPAYRDTTVALRAMQEWQHQNHADDVSWRLLMLETYR